MDQGNEMTLVQRSLNGIREKRQRILDGGVNCIPSAFNRFRSDFVGIQQKKYYLVTAHQKGAKTQFTSYVFIYQPLMYAYQNPDKIHLKIFYFPLEETKERIIIRFMSYLLYMKTDGEIHISPEDLESTNEEKPLSKDIIDILATEEYQSVLRFFEEHVEFCDASNPTGMYKRLSEYAETHGRVHKKDIVVRDKITGQEKVKSVFDYYEPDDPLEYVEIIWDHISLTTPEQGMDLRNTINNLSAKFVTLRNNFGYIPVVVQQQSTETQSLDAYKANKIRPTVSGLADSKYTARDCNMMLGLTNPYAFHKPDEEGYDITRLRDNFRVLEVVVNRDGRSNGSIGLYFDGAVNEFKELPPAQDERKMSAIYTWVEQRRKKILTFFSYIKNGKNNCYSRK